jgi:N-acetylneuraminic acid mutarotase
MVVFGGFVDGERTNDVYIFTFRDSRWQRVNTQGSLPKVRAGHSAIMQNGSMVVFGGRDEDGDRLNDIWSLNL